MNILVAGSRTMQDSALICGVLNTHVYPAFCKDIVIITGGAKGVDSIAHHWATQKGMKTHIEWADWKKHGRKAGYIRNQVMVDMCDMAIIIWDEKSPGTKHTISQVKKKNTPYIIIKYASMQIESNNASANLYVERPLRIGKTFMLNHAEIAQDICNLYWRTPYTIDKLSDNDRIDI